MTQWNVADALGIPRVGFGWFRSFWEVALEAWAAPRPTHPSCHRSPESLRARSSSCFDLPLQGCRHVPTHSRGTADASLSVIVARTARSDRPHEPARRLEVGP